MHHAGHTLHLDDIDCPGAYVCHWNGDLLRVVREIDDPDGMTLPDLPVDDGPRLLTLLSPDPYIPLSVARMTAANMDLEIQC